MPESILLDTNLALLLVVGITDRAFVGRHKRLTAYSEDDFDHLVSILDQSSRIEFCPNVWSETSNLVRYSPPGIRVAVSRTLASLIDKVTESYIESRQASKRPEFSALGLTDSVLLHLAERGGVLLTSDLDLYLAAQRAGYSSAVNFNHLREARYAGR
jgi:hypothetical protein